MLVAAPIEVVILIILPFFVAVIATIIYTDNVVRARKAASESANPDNSDSGTDGIDSGSNDNVKDLTDDRI